MPDRPSAGQACHHLGVAVIISDQPKTLMRVKPHAIMRDDAGRLLPPMLERMQP